MKISNIVDNPAPSVPSANYASQFPPNNLFKNSLKTNSNMKVGDLRDVQVYKSKPKNQQFLLAYEIIDSTLFLLAFGSHENFYRDLKKYLQ